MKKLLCVALAAMVIMLAVVPACAASIRGISEGMTLYVDVSSSAKLNLRAEPSTSAKSIAKLSRGTAVVAGADYEAPFLKITVNGKTGWVDIKYLSVSKPKGDSSSSTPIGKLNFKSFAPVTGVVIVTAKPPRVGSSVNLRWVPSTEGSVLRRAYAGDTFRVVTEGKDWYQVQTDDGYVVFIAKKFTTVIYSGDEAGYQAMLEAAQTDAQ